MGNELSIFDSTPSKLPAHLQTFNSGIISDLTIGGIGRNRIGLKGSRFRLIVSGQEEAVIEQTSLDVIIVGTAKGVQRIFFEENYNANEKVHPSCYSADGVAPANDVTNPQSTKCAACPQNQKGSKITDDGTKTKACAYFKRLVLAIVGDKEHRAFQLDAKALSIFGVGEPAQNKFTLNEYAKKFQLRGLDPSHYVTKLSFDLKSSIPKLYFTPVRVITENEASWVSDMVNSDAVKALCEITAVTDDSDADSEKESIQKQVEAKPAKQVKEVQEVKVVKATPKAKQAIKEVVEESPEKPDKDAEFEQFLNALETD